MSKTFILDHVIDFREEDLHKKSMFCRCNPLIYKKQGYVMHNSLLKEKPEKSDKHWVDSHTGKERDQHG